MQKTVGVVLIKGCDVVASTSPVLCQTISSTLNVEGSDYARAAILRWSPWSRVSGSSRRPPPNGRKHEKDDLLCDCVGFAQVYVSVYIRMFSDIYTRIISLSGTCLQS